MQVFSGRFVVRLGELAGLFVGLLFGMVIPFGAASCTLSAKTRPQSFTFSSRRFALCSCSIATNVTASRPANSRAVCCWTAIGMDRGGRHEQGGHPRRSERLASVIAIRYDNNDLQMPPDERLSDERLRS